MLLTGLILVFILALVLIFLEFVVLPGVTVPGVLGFVLLVGAIYVTYTNYGAGAGNGALIASITVTVALAVFGLRSKTWNKVSLHKNLEGKVNVVDKTKLTVGTKGKTLSRLAPGGNANFDGHIVEVFTYGEFVDQSTEVEIISINNNQIFVKPLI